MMTQPEKPDLKPGSPKYVIAIDLGSTSIKAALVTDKGEVLSGVEEPVDTIYLPDGGAEVNPDQWWNGAKKAIKTLIRNSGVEPRDIQAIGCDSAWFVVVPVDKNGEPLMNAVHWMDLRGGKYNREIIGGFPEFRGYNLFKLSKWIRRAGLAPSSSGVDSVGHILFIKNERPEIYKKTHKFLEPMDFLTSRLTGKITATQKTACVFMISDTREWGSLKYDEALVKMAGLDIEKFPDLIPNDGVVGPLSPSVAEELGLLNTTQVVAGVCDSNASIIGSGAVENFDPILYIGTTQYLNCHVPFKKIDIFNLIATIPSPFPSTHMLFAEQGSGGRCVEHYLKNFVYPDDNLQTGPIPEDIYDRFAKNAARAPAGSGGVIYLPWLNGALSPNDDPHARSGFINFSIDTTRAHLSRSIMEGLAYNNRWCKEAMEKLIKRPLKHLRFSGGGATSDTWSQILADVIGIPIHQIDDPTNTTVRGTALLALMSLGQITKEEIPQRVHTRKVFEPQQEHRQLYDKMFSQYKMLYKNNTRTFATLNR